MSIHIHHDPQNKQFITIVDEKTSSLRYDVLPDGKTLDYYSTFVPPELRGRNIGQEIVKFALEYAQKNNYKVIPSCPFVKTYIDRHLEFQKLTVL